MNNLIASLMSRKMKTTPINMLIFVILLLMLIDSVLLIDWFLQNGFQKLKFLFSTNMNSMLLPWLTLLLIWIAFKKE